VYRKIRNALASHSINMGGWTTNRKIVVFESDDWGSIRMPSRVIYEKLLSKGFRVDKCPYNKNDSLASEEDLASLFEILIKFRDKNDNHPVITANTIIANPDFDKIEESDFKEYYYELFTETLKKYPKHENSFSLWNQGINEQIFYPQFHGKEHVNIKRWLKLLRDKNEYFRYAFAFGLWGLSPAVIDTGKINIQASFDTTDINDLLNHKEILNDGLNQFEYLFRYRSKSFIASNFIWHPDLNNTLKENGVSVIQGMKYQLLPYLDKAKHSRVRHRTGQEINGQIYLVRNCAFEPTLYPGIDTVSSCLRDISNSFLWKKPAIITVHRLNFIGFIDEENRTQNLVKLYSLLSSIIKRWPDVEFMTSVELGNLITNYSGKLTIDN
jgi:hypothetical protein